jgi:hypothetical protein
MHSHHHHREHQVAHRRVAKVLEESHPSADKHAHGGGFSKVTSKSAAMHHASSVHGHKAPKRYARGGKVKHEGKGGHTTNIAIVMPHKGAGTGAPMAGAPPGGAPPMSGPPPMPGGPPGAGGPPGMPPMPMHKRGGKVHDGESTKGNLKEWAARAKGNSFFRGGAATGVGREEKAAHQRRKGK